MKNVVGRPRGKAGLHSRTREELWTSFGTAFFTLFLSSWSVLCVNVPQPGQSNFEIVWRKVILMGLCALGPEFILQAALGQLVSARRSVKLFHDSGYRGWTLSHAFYADMGAILLQPEGWESFPIDARQLHYLVVNEYIEYPRIEKNHIRDKNKMDGLLRAITVLQATWFVINLILRAAQKLTITTLELTTSAFIVCGVLTSLCWIRKPADVRVPDTIHTRASIETILYKAGSVAARPYQKTPLDFVSRKEWSWSILWYHGLYIFQRCGISFSPTARPLNRFQNTVIPEIDGLAYAVLLLVVGLNFAIFVAGWNFSFPSQVESTMWRVASLTSLASLPLFYLICTFAFDTWPAIRK